MSPKEIGDVLFQIFSKEGYKVNGLTIQSESPLIANIFSDNTNTHIKFGTNHPKAAIKRFITLYAYIEEIVLGKDGGSIKLKNFPDIKFSYEKSIISFFDENFQFHADISNEIEKKYTNPVQKKIAHLCLQYATEWATIARQNKDFSGISDSEKRALRSQCINFVVENVRDEFEKEHGSIVVTYILLVIIIPAIARFIITRLLEKYF